MPLKRRAKLHGGGLERGVHLRRGGNTTCKGQRHSRKRTGPRRSVSAKSKLGTQNWRLFMIQEETITTNHKSPQPISGKLGATIIGPTNPTREAENPDTLVPPRVDHGTMANLRWSFADS